jgi:hypothetical protein
MQMLSRKLHSFILRYFLDEEKPMRDNRQAEIYLQNIFTIKMEDSFDSPKHFYQNVCHTLLKGILSDENGKNPLMLKTKVRVTKLQDIALDVLNSASKNFQTSPTLKIAFGGNQPRLYDDFRGGYGRIGGPGENPRGAPA